MLGVLGRTGGGLVRILRARDVSEGGEPCYRQLPKVTRRQVIHSELLSGFMWFWILWHFWHSPGSVLGHFPYPDSSEWTDEELGIPPDDEE